MEIRRIQGEYEKQKGMHYEFNPASKPLGAGGIGVVYRGWMFDDYTGQQREVAIKELHAGLPQHVIVRAKREASVRLRNDNLVEMISFVEVPMRDELGISVTRYYVVSEYLHGVTLDALLEGKFSDYLGATIPFVKQFYLRYMSDSYHFALTVVRNVLSGLMALHDAGYIHRDIDPSNIMITSDGHIKLIDFGIAKYVKGNLTDEASYTQVGQFMGKPKYAAPELARGLTNSLGFPTDIYAVGILLFQLVVGHVPFEGDMAEVLEKQINKPIPLGEIKQRELRKVLKCATHKNKDKRYQSAAEFRVAIEKLYTLPYPEKSLGLRTIVLVCSSALVLMAASWALVTYLRDDASPQELAVATNPIPTEPSSAPVPSQPATAVSSPQQPEENLVAAADIQPKQPDVKSDRMLLTEAFTLLRSPATAQQGLDQLNLLTSSTQKDVAYDSYFLLSRLYFHNDADVRDVPDSIRKMQAALRNVLNVDNIKAHQLLVKAVDINGEDYHSLYELGCDYMSKGKRGAGRDLEQARSLLIKARSLAEKAQDKPSQRKISSKISKL